MATKARTRRSRVSSDEEYNVLRRASNLFLAVVSRAFQILSDSDKKAQYDKYGGDPDSRFNPGPSASSSGGGGGSPFGNGFGGGFPRSAAGSAGFDAEISPEELFNRFFNGGLGGMGGGFSPFGMTAHARPADDFD